VLVDAHQAEYDLIQTARVETGRRSGLGFGRLLSGIGDATSIDGPAELRVDLSTYASSKVSHGKSSRFGSAVERYQLTEHLVVPDHWYDITGTCVENPEAQDEYDRNLIMKGTNEPTFLITWRSEKEIRWTLRYRAAQYIFGGALLAIVCLGILLIKYGWL
jgi:hypothetical protein